MAVVEGQGTSVGPQPAVLRLPPELLTRLVGQDSRSAFRLCSRAWRDAADSAVRSLRITYGAAIPSLRPPEPIVFVEKSLRGFLGHGCQPYSLSLRLDDFDVEREAKGLAVFTILAAARSIKELRLHGLTLSPHITAAIGAAAPHLTKLSLSGACTSRHSLALGLSPLLSATPSLTELTLLNVTTAKPAWQPLSGHAPLRSLYLHLAERPGGLNPGDTADMAAGLASLTQLTDLNLEFSLVDHRDVQPPLTTVLPALCASLTRLRSLSLRSGVPPPNLLACLVSLPALESLSVRGWNTSMADGLAEGVQDVHLLPQLTALTSLNLTPPLASSSIQHAMADSAAAAGGSAAPAIWRLPPALRMLLLNKPLPLLELAALDPPSSLTSVRLSPEPMVLPKTPPEAAERQLAAVVPRLAAWGVDPLALALPAGGYHPAWFRQLAPLQLRGLRLCGECMGEGDAEALAEALGGCLEELTLQDCGSSLLRMLPGLMRMQCLRNIIVSGLRPPVLTPEERAAMELREQEE